MTSQTTYYSTDIGACNNGPTATMQTFYHNGVGSCPQGAPGNQNIIYIDAAGTQKLSDVVNTSGKWCSYH